VIVVAAGLRFLLNVPEGRGPFVIDEPFRRNTAADVVRFVDVILDECGIIFAANHGRDAEHVVDKTAIGCRKPDQPDREFVFDQRQVQHAVDVIAHR